MKNFGLSANQKRLLIPILEEKQKEISFFVSSSPKGNRFGIDSIFDVCIAVCSSLVLLNKALDAVESIFDRLQKLHNWIGKGQEQLSIHEKILALVAKEYANTNEGLNKANFAELLPNQPEYLIHETLEELTKLEILRKKPDGTWILRTRLLS